MQRTVWFWIKLFVENNSWTPQKWNPIKINTLWYKICLERHMNWSSNNLCRDEKLSLLYKCLCCNFYNKLAHLKAELTRLHIHTCDQTCKHLQSPKLHHSIYYITKPLLVWFVLHKMYFIELCPVEEGSSLNQYTNIISRMYKLFSGRWLNSHIRSSYY